MYRLLTELTIIFHLVFILFVIAGGILVWRWRWISVPHLAALAWAVFVELTPGIYCPLTTVENYFAERAGITSYKGDFITHYLVPIIYPHDLSPNTFGLIGVFLVVLNLLIYSIILWKRSKRGRRSAQEIPTKSER